MASALDQLARVPLCTDLTRDELARLVEAGRMEKWPSDSVIMEEGTSGPRLVILLDGRVSVRKRSAGSAGQVIAELGRGAVLGEMSLLTDQPRSASVHALTSLKLFAIDRRNFEEMARDADPAALKIGLAIARVLAERVASLNQRLVDQLDELQ